jgi:hypothetical protein
LNLASGESGLTLELLKEDHQGIVQKTTSASFSGDTQTTMGKLRGGEFYRITISSQPSQHVCYIGSKWNYTVSGRQPNDSNLQINIYCEPGTVPASVSQLSGAVKCSQITFFSDESVGLYWGSSGGASTYLISFSLVGDPTLQNIPLYAGPAQISLPFYGVLLPETPQHYIDAWPGKTVRYSVTGISSSGVPSYPVTIDVPLLQLQDIFAADKSNMCYFWPDYNLRGYGPLFQ